MKVQRPDNKHRKISLYTGVALSLFTSFCFAFPLDICVRSLQNSYPEHYLSVALVKKIEKAILESGNSINCGKNSTDLSVYVKDFKESPVAYTPQQRVSAYNLSISIALKVGESEKSYVASTFYSQETGSLGNIARRRALDTVMDIIYLNIVEELRKLR